VLVYAVVSDQTEKAVGLFVHREQAARFLENVRADEPELAERLRLERRSCSTGPETPPLLRGAVRPATTNLRRTLQTRRSKA
jgi:hypothetical protein